ncbi:MAG TPA: DUF262 domain-containing protein [Flavobacteriia bacterium]|nr:DUF262 domain-containing protein [Flavobacteriia bacterium]
MKKEVNNIEENLTEIENDIIENPMDGYITDPFSTKDIKITNAVISLSSLINRLKEDYDEIDLNPDFQRHANLWNQTSMSRLIESILLKLPLPIFYFDVSNPDKWIVVDGLQRLSTIKKFVVDKKLKLKNLEFLTDLNGKSYDELERTYKRVIDETQIITYQIEAQTPKEVRYSIFNRINTGGLSLNAQEIRQALNQQGKGITFLDKCSQNQIFKKIVNAPSKRMLDRELILRFIAFKLTENAYKNFPYNTMGEFLDKAMEKLDDIQDNTRLEKLQIQLIDTLRFSEQVLGEGHRFSRSIADNNKTKTLNRSLYDVITVCFSNIDHQEKFLSNKDIFIKKFLKLLQNESSDFSKAITEGTSGKNAIEKRFEIMENLIAEVMNED